MVRRHTEETTTDITRERHVTCMLTTEKLTKFEAFFFFGGKALVLANDWQKSRKKLRNILIR